MEKLTPKHNHTLTDILKVAIFGIILLLPFLLFLPSIAYFGFNKEANVPTKQVEVQEEIVVDFNQLKINGNFENNTTYYTNLGTLLVQNNEGTFTSGSGNRNYLTAENLPVISNHKYIFSFEINALYNLRVQYPVNASADTITSNTNYVRYQKLLSYTGTPYNQFYFYNYDNLSQGQLIFYIKNIQFFDLTQMYGTGNEPTIERFNIEFSNSYYPTTESQKMLVERTIGTETLADITTQVELNWQQLWNRPLFSWTKYTILIQGLDKFTYIFGIVDTCYITNLLTYELVMIAIYIVLDIILKMFTWLTHMIGNA